MQILDVACQGMRLPILTDEDVEELDKREKVFESVPSWATSVPALPETLRIPDEDGSALKKMDDDRASPAFKDKNILLWHPHVLFHLGTEYPPKP